MIAIDKDLEATIKGLLPQCKEIPSAYFVTDSEATFGQANGYGWFMEAYGSWISHQRMAWAFGVMALAYIKGHDGPYRPVMKKMLSEVIGDILL